MDRYREQWKENSKKGDKVLKIKKRYEKQDDYYIDFVIGKTKTGSLKFESGDLLKLDEYWSRDGFAYQPYNEEAEAKMNLQRKNRLANLLIQYVNISEFSEEELDLVIKLFNRKVFHIHSLTGYGFIKFEGDDVISSKTEPATLFTYEEALEVYTKLQTLTDKYYNIYKNGTRVK